MYTFKILYSYNDGKKTAYYAKLITVARPEGVDEPITEAGNRVRALFAKHFDTVTTILLGVHFLYWENYVLRDDEKVSSVRALEILSDWLDADRARAEEERKVAQ